MIKKIIPILFLLSVIIVYAENIDVSQDTLLQNLNYGEVNDRSLSITNNTSDDVDLTITLIDQTWIPPLNRSVSQEENLLPDTPTTSGFTRDHICGTADPNPEDLLVTINQVEHWLESQSRNSRSIVSVKIAWHVIHQADGVGDLSDQQIAQQVTWLNNAFAEHDFIFTLDIIDRTVNNDWFSDMYDTYDAIAKQALNIDSYHYLNIYTSNIFVDDVAGYAYLPNAWSEGSYMHGVVLDYRTLPYVGGNDGDVGVHEVGHYLGLHHTFYNNCTVGNDGVDDTPAHHEDYLWQCNNNLDSCPNLPGNDPVHNYMTYTSNSCQWEFTPGQQDRMQAMIAQYRPHLLENPVEPSWMTTASDTITVPANGSADITLTFDATESYGGTYYSDINIAAEALDTSIIVSATLNITGIPEINLDATTFTFDDTYVNDTSVVKLELYNVGSDDLIISGLVFENDYFFSNITNITVDPDQSQEVSMYFVPDSVGQFSGELNIQSNDSSNPEINVMLNGAGLISPLSLSFESLSDTIAANDFTSHLLTLSNTGDNAIYFDISHTIDWLTIDIENDSIDVGQTQQISFNINTLFMNYGEYSGDVSINTNVGLFTIHLTILVAQLGVEDEISGIPERFEVHKNYPNPFNPITNVQIGIPKKGHLFIQVHNISGRVIATLANEEIGPGFHSIRWNGKNQLGISASSGVYILNVQYDGQHISQKMLLVK